MPTKTTKKTKASKRVAASEGEADGFGDGLIEGTAAPKKKRAAKKKAASRKKKAVPAAESVDSGGDDEEVAKPKKKKAAKKRKPAARKKSPEGDGAHAKVISSGGRDNIGRSAAEFDFVDDSAEETPKRRTRRSRPADEDDGDTFGGELSGESKSESRDDESEGRGARGRGRSRRGSDDSSDAGEGSSDRDRSRSEGGGGGGGGGGSGGEPKGESEGDGRVRRGRRGRRGRARKPEAGTDAAERNKGNNQRGRGRGGSHGGSNGHNRQQSRGDRRTVEPVSENVEGVLELHPKGYGFVRDRTNDYAAQETDPFVSGQLIDRYNLREGILLTGEVGPGHRGQGPRLKTVDSVEGEDPEKYVDIPDFDSLTPINPEEQIKLEVGPSPLTMRVLDLLCPIGKGQRALIVAPPRSGKTMLMQQIADSVAHNHPECHLMVLLIDERPEEVTDMRRSVKGEVIASSIDRELENHVRISQLALERAKRLAEMGKDVFLLLDSITRTARAFNKWTNTGRTGTGGLDVRAMDVPKKLFATARVFDEGGSVTVVGTALVETGSRMDDAIFQEFKGTGNMELVLSRDLADRRIWPAMNIQQSGTRREEKLIDAEKLEGITMMRRSLVTLHSAEAMEQLTKTLMKFPTNDEFLAKIRNVM